MELLNSGVDSLYWTARGDVRETMAALSPYQEAARADHRAAPWREIAGFALMVEPAGGSGYAAILKCAEFSVYLGQQKSRPTFWVQLRADFIYTVGIRGAIDASLGVVSELSENGLQDTGVSRVDPFADFGGWSLGKDEAEGIVTRVPEVSSYFVPRSNHLHSVRIGKKPLALRIYDKRYQLEKMGGAADLFWGDHEGPVTRVEFEFWSERLKDFTLRSFDEVLASIGDLWRHGTTRFAELRVPGAGPVELWPVSPAWRFVQRLAEWKFAYSGLVPFRIVKGDRTTLLRSVYGYLTSFAGVEGLSTAHATLRRVLECLPEVDRGRSFEDEAKRKAARLPKTYRQREAM